MRETLLSQFPPSEADLGTGYWPLFTRSWVFQERFLSQRVIHFGQQQAHWECRSTRLSEYWRFSAALPVTSFSDILSDKSSDHREAWHRIVEQYTALELTFKKDRLPAIAAVVERVMSTSARSGDHYLAGLWEKSLILDMAWYNSTKGPLRPRSSLQGPTWTCSSV